MRINDVLKELESRKRMYGINEFRACLNELGNPHLKLKCVHVAGTNGKGSTSNFIQSIFKQSYKVGLFTSPYLIKHNDRIRINDTWISDEKIIEYYEKYNDLWLKYQLSSFEIDMFMAIYYFIENEVDFCVFEVGLGGLLDATNVIDSFLSIITNIAFDHMEFLGNDLESIATAKAGIIKPNSTFMTLDVNHRELYEAICGKNNTKCIILDSIPERKNNKNAYQFNQFNIDLAMHSTYQIENSFLALNAALEIKKHFPISDALIENGINQALWRGRFEKISDQPLVYVDGAHNVAGIDALIQTLQNYPKVKILFSALKDKEYQEMLRRLSAHFDDISVTTFDFYRALNKADLQALEHVKYVESVEDFLKENANYDGLIMICGSLYFISSILKGE